MKRIALSLLCLSAFTYAVIAQDTPADNPDNNKRDHSGETKTSGDQSNSAEDIKTTAAIRRAIVDDSSLTMTARNVKIITENGTVTLRGQVSSADQKAKILVHAAKVVGGERVVNEIEIKDSK